MSRYLVNKVIWEVDRTDHGLAAFKTDPRGFLDAWTGSSEGGSLSGDERKALETRDYAGLYAMGANPFLLWQFARSVSVPDEMTVEELIASFREAIEPHGYPDFHT
ncbi:MAG: hypothetical protein ACRDX9_03905 [Acidimicrobiia bacterium]